MCKKFIATTILSAFLCTFFPAPAALAADNVQVTLPSFTVTLNGQSTSNDYSKYPLLVYKDITYFPMTYYDCRLLGVKTDWTKDTGLVIGKNEDYFYEYLREVNNSKNARKQTAKIADGKITVNGKVIDNRKEEYPLLVFRDVTYFPLTWRFAVDELGWQYRFNQKEGLVIDNDKVKLENPENASWVSGDMGSTAGQGGGKIFLANFPQDETLQVKQSNTNSLNPTTISMTYVAANKKFENLTLSCQIYKTIGQQKELVYKKILPIFSGIMETETAHHLNTNLAYWNTPNLQSGTYKAGIAVSEPNTVKEWAPALPENTIIIK